MIGNPAPRLSEFPDLVERDLSFDPVVNPHPRMLTAEQIAQYNGEGYIHPFRIFDEEQIARNQKYFRHLLETICNAKDGRDSYSINSYQDRCRGIYDLIKTERILDYVQDIVGSDFVCWGAHYFCKLPGDNRTVPWHQDATYWPFVNSRTVTVWLAIDDADVGNACMHVIPGTHTVGHVAHGQVQGQVLRQQIDDVEQYGTPVPIELKAGQISLHADMLIHGSGPNLSRRQRGGLTLRYCPVGVSGYWNTASILCRGKDPSGHWADIPRPAGEDPRPHEYQMIARAG